jgi:hypothetical protein
MVADGGNYTDVYGAVNFAKQYGMNKKNVEGRIIVVRGIYCGSDKATNIS